LLGTKEIKKNVVVKDVLFQKADSSKNKIKVLLTKKPQTHTDPQRKL
jgi:hypothetical protein